MEEIKKEAPEVPVQELENMNFNPYTGVKLHNTCPKCWVKNDKSYKCGFGKCPGLRLLVIEANSPK